VQALTLFASVTPIRPIIKGLSLYLRKRTLIGTALPDFRFDIVQFPFRFNPGTNGKNVEMSLINKSFLVTLNGRRGPLHSNLGNHHLGFDEVWTLQRSFQ
jgi:hypothetical protein